MTFSDVKSSGAPPVVLHGHMTNPGHSRVKVDLLVSYSSQTGALVLVLVLTGLQELVQVGPDVTGACPKGGSLMFRRFWTLDHF